MGTQPNLVAGGKRMLSSQCPAMVEHNGDLIFVTGSPGGRTIINTVLCNILNLIQFDMSPAATIAALDNITNGFPIACIWKMSNPRRML
ncbi:MAG: gamma-glutamyltransferase [Pirellulaceae bacterium]